MEALIAAVESGDYTQYIRQRSRYPHTAPPQQVCWAAVRGNNWLIFKNLREWGMNTRVWRSVHRISTPLQLCATMRNIRPEILIALMQDYWDIRNWQGETAKDIAQRLHHPTFNRIFQQTHPSGPPR